MAGRVAQDFDFFYHKCDVSSQLIMKSWSRINNLTKNKKTSFITLKLKIR